MSIVTIGDTSDRMAQNLDGGFWNVLMHNAIHRATKRGRSSLFWLVGCDRVS